jgi:hypothetical protein
MPQGLLPWRFSALTFGATNHFKRVRNAYVRSFPSTFAFLHMRFLAASHRSIAASWSDAWDADYFLRNAQTKVAVGFECKHGDLELWNHNRE